VKLQSFGLLTDQNLHPQVVAFLRAAGFDVLDVYEQGLQGTSDLDLLKRAVAEKRLIV
jgi:predicted nuclease of predicted toxin-antitoxin system